jgi:muconolactone delta-isomerase
VEFLIAHTITVRKGTPSQTVNEARTRETERAHELAEQGHPLRLWAPAAQCGERRILGPWRARDATEMREILESLPLYPWTTVKTTPLSQHPNDPAIKKS